MIRRWLAAFGMRLCDFGLWVFSLGPLDEEDKALRRQLIERWRELKGRL
jgi:hypothetical protein